jgi:Family of unknown function (DUF6084)
MTDLLFEIAGVKTLEHAVAPTLAFRLRITAARPVNAILLQSQLRIEPRRRSHGADEQTRLTDVFGTPDRWNETLHPLTWAQSTVNVTQFEKSTEVDLPVACTYDFEVTAAKYLSALDRGDVPLRFLFSGTIFIKSENGYMVEQVPWNKEAVYRMPVAVWRELMDSYFPGSAWIRLRRETLDLLQRCRAQSGLVSWDEVIQEIVDR